MNSRDRILAAVARNQPALVAMPEIPTFLSEAVDLAKKFSTVAVGIGSKVFEVESLEEIKEILRQEYKDARRVVSSYSRFLDFAEVALPFDIDPHTLENIDLAILQAHFGVAENSALWITEDQLPQRVLPFICQHLALIVPRQEIVPLMHNAYNKIGNANYSFGTFIAGPSKTADIEQSLVLGAHGPRTLTIFIINEDLKEREM
ncbi:LUD domain-containing protein [Pontibacter sp. SGAir0037]|uniref:LutC/YkgG family protein n=1 Tax=Pontibacter sp. SGAir0037 TaxID=2571030 RepID=UPI0010CD4BBD|nr:LUD domain-containing protein [Pontibacter sp. SGAir0037]QCR21319.1 lactate utilization protein B/C [Pontibacter sp. SGAir0037]